MNIAIIRTHPSAFMKVSFLVMTILIHLPNQYAFVPKFISYERIPLAKTSFTTKNNLQESISKSSTTLFMGYQFGDISKSIGKKLANAINEKTGKEKYEFGDLSRWLDKKAKENAASITGKDEYEFGDLSIWVDARVKDKVNEMSGKSEYEFGDLTKEILRRVFSGEERNKQLLSTNYQHSFLSTVYAILRTKYTANINCYSFINKKLL